MPERPGTTSLDCPYCGNAAKFVRGDVIYSHRPDLFEKGFYLCRPCDAYVGCHPGTKEPLGRLANAELRQAKQAAHRAFDPLWKNSSKKRSEVYTWLAVQLDIPPSECHIGMFDVVLCKRVVEVCEDEVWG